MTDMLITKTTANAIYPERSRYLFDEMAIGDCMFFDDFKHAESARVAARQFSKRKRPDWRFSIRKMTDGWRVFRID
jgi:hypothetical protein